MEPPIALAARRFAVVSGIDCLPLDLEAAGPSTSRGCSICEAALRGHLPPETADGIHRFAAYQSERLGGRYVYVCSYTLLHTAAPILVDDTLTAVLVSGPAVLGSLDDEVVRAIVSSHAGSLMSADAVVAWLSTIPRVSPEEASAVADTLGRVALSCCDRHGIEYMQERPQPTGGADVAAYIDYLTSMEGDKRSSMRYPVEIEQELMERVSTGDRSGAEELLGVILSAVGAYEDRSTEEARSRVLELVVLLSRAAIAGGADAEEVFGLEYRSLTRLRRLETVEQIESWLTRILSRFVDLVFDLRHMRYSSHLARVLSFIRENYREPISLSDAANAADLSAGYLSRIFSSELHTSFTRYVRQLRLQQAKRLLRTTSQPVGDVAAQCGFADHSYFTQLFRRQTGQSPSEYREIRRY